MSVFIPMVSGLISLTAIILLAKGSNKTQVLLRQGHERDTIIDILAWIDRKVFVRISSNV